MHYLYIIGTVLFALCGQLTLKWRIHYFGSLPESYNDIINYLFKVLIDPYIILSFLNFFIAAIFWIIVLTKFNLNYAYPIVLCVSILTVFAFSSILFKEQVTVYNIGGVICILFGLMLISK